jgi:hypothetical protein
LAVVLAEENGFEEIAASAREELRVLERLLKSQR